MKSKNSSSSSESYFRAQYESVCKERDALQGTIEAQERDIDELKKSVYELSYMLSMQGSAGSAPMSTSTSPAPAVVSPGHGGGGSSTEVRPPSRAVFDPRVGLATAHLDSLSLMGGGGIGVGVVGGGSGSATTGRVLVHEAKLSGHTAAVYVAKFSPRDSLVASAGFDRTLRLWEGSYPFSQVACLEGHRQLISDLCWAPDGRSLLSASFDQVGGFAADRVGGAD